MAGNYLYLPKAKGKWDGVQVRFECDKRQIPGNVSTIWIFEMRLDNTIQYMKQVPANEDLAISIEKEMGVVRKYFRLCATEGNCQPDVRAVCQDDRCMVSLVIGQAEIKYSVKYKNGKSSRKAWISLRSNRVVEQGVLGYEYLCGNGVIRQGIPGSIMARTKIKFPMVQIPLGTEIRIVPMEDEFRGNLAIYNKHIIV